jgi:hypothetical protein
MTIRRVADIRFVTHAVQVSRDTFTDRIYLFKHTDQLCDYASFDRVEDATDYILTPFASLQWQVNIEGEDPAQFS